MRLGIGGNSAMFIKIQPPLCWWQLCWQPWHWLRAISRRAARPKSIHWLHCTTS